MQGRLVTAQEVGTGFTGGATAPKGTQPLPCTPSASPLSTQVPARQTAFATFSNEAATSEAAETVYQYSSATAAQRALTIAIKGFSCSQGTVSGKPVRIVTRAPRTTKESVTLAAWDFAASKDALGTAVVLQTGDRIAVLELLANGVDRYAIDIPALVDHAAARLR